MRGAFGPRRHRPVVAETWSRNLSRKFYFISELNVVFAIFSDIKCENYSRAFFTKPPARKENAAENEKKIDESKIPAKTKTLQEHSQSSATLT